MWVGMSGRNNISVIFCVAHMTAFSFMSSVFPVDQGPLKKINCCSQSMISASSFVHNALEVSLASLGLDLAFCRHTLHLGNNITYSA